MDEVLTLKDIAYCSMMKQEFYFSENDLEVVNKQLLSTDLWIIRKSWDVKIKNEIGKLFKGYNIIDYK